MSGLSSVGVSAPILNQSNVIQEPTLSLIWCDLRLESKMRFLDKMDSESNLGLGGRVYNINQKIADYKKMPEESDRFGDFMAGAFLIAPLAVGGAIGFYGSSIMKKDVLLTMSMICSISVPAILGGSKGFFGAVLSCGVGYLISRVVSLETFYAVAGPLPVACCMLVTGLAFVVLGDRSCKRELEAKKTEVDSLRKEFEGVLDENKDTLISKLKGRVEVLTTELEEKENALKALKDVSGDFTVESVLPKIQKIETARLTLKENKEILRFLQGLK